MSEQTCSRQYRRANQTCRNGDGTRNRNNWNIENEKENKHNAPYIQKEVWNKMAPEVRKYHIEVSKKGRPDQQSYGSQYGGKVPTNNQKNQQRDQNMGGTTQEDNNIMTKM